MSQTRAAAGAPQTAPSTPAAPSARLTPRMLSHLAYVTPDAEATADFYTRVMGMEFVLAVMDDEVPSTGEPIPYFHIFFRLGDGSTLAFFEAPGVPARPPAPHPAYDTFDHLAFQVDSTAEVDAWHEHLVASGVDVLGPVDHKIIYSVYFHDPVNGLRLEITTPLVPDWNDRGEAAWAALAEWSAAKRRAGENGTGSADEVLAVIKARRHRDTPEPR